MPNEYENAFDKHRDSVADYSDDELRDAADRLERKKPHLSIEQKAKLDAINAEADYRFEIAMSEDDR